MKIHAAAATLALALLFAGCAALENKVVVGTSTILGFEVAQNPATQLYQIRFGYARAEMAIVPTNGLDVITELQFKNVTGNGGLYQRMAVGPNAVKQSTFMFAKNASGNLDPQTADAVGRSISSVPVANPLGTAAKVPLAEAYRVATNRAAYDVVAQTLGYISYEAFLLNSNLSADQVQAMRTALKDAGISVP